MLFNKNDINGLFINHETGIPTLTTQFNQLSVNTTMREMIGLFKTLRDERSVKWL